MRSGPAAGTEDSASSSDNLSLPARLVGVIRRPRPTFADVAASPRATLPLLLLFAVPFALSAAFYATEVGRQALVDQWERTAIAFGQPVDDARYAAFQKDSERALPYAAGMALIGGPLAAAGLAAVLFGVLTGLKGGAASYRQVLGVVAHAGVVLILRQLVATPVNYARESTASPVSLGRLFAMLDEASPAARFLGLIDVFVLWWILVLSIGLSVLYALPSRYLVIRMSGVYIAIALVLAGMMAVLGNAG